jgi:hypothetical protein
MVKDSASDSEPKRKSPSSSKEESQDISICSVKAEMVVVALQPFYLFT